MRAYQQIMTGIALMTAMTFPGCYIETFDCKVKEEFGTLPGLVNNSGGFLSDKAIKIDKPKYGLVLENGEDEYTLEVINYSHKSNFALEKKIEVGDTVRITLDTHTKIAKDGVGKVNSTSIEVIAKAGE
jgi:hypothetical protein